MENINEIYSKWYTNIYDRMEEFREDVDLYLDMVGDKPVNILEAACGSGRILVPLAEAGHTVSGFDRNDKMLELIARKSSLSNLNCRQMDAIEGDWGSDYDIVIMGGNLLLNVEGVLPYEDIQRLFISKAAKALKTGGHLILEFGLFAHPEKIFAPNEGRLIYEGADASGVYGKFFVINTSYDSATQMASGSRRFDFTMPDGETASVYQTWAKHVPTLTQVHRWLRESGLEVEEEYGDFRRNPISETTDHAILWSVLK